MFNDLIGKNKELGKFLFCERYTLQPVKNALRIAEGQELKRGAVVDVNGYLIGTKSIVPYAVLEFDCDTREGGKQASVFTMGEFNFDKLTFGEGMSKNDIDNIVYNGKKLGIVIKPYEYAEGFIPAMAPAGTSQSNPLMTAEETERMIAAMKPIDDMTLRFEFSKKNYNPETADVGSAGTWTKVDSPTLNVWDWTNEATDWSNSFKGAFTDADNEVRVIAAGDTSSVTKTEYMFAGIFTKNPANSSYELTSRNNVVYFCKFDFSNCTTSNYMFCGTTLRNFEKSVFKSTSNNYIFGDSFIEKVETLDFSGSNTMSGCFARCYKLKKVGTIKVSGTLQANALGAMFWGQAGCYSVLEEFGGFDGNISNCTNFASMFSNCCKLEKITNGLDLSNVSSLSGTFNGCEVLDFTNITGLNSGSVTNLSTTFFNCKKFKLPNDINTSSVGNFSNSLRSCIMLDTLIPLSLGSATNVSMAFRGCYNVKYGILEAYQALLARGASITNHTDCFKDCGRDTPEGRAALAQIPASWGGLAEG